MVTGRSVRDRSGMAALFDALMFLSVMAVVSVAVLVAFTPRSSADGDVQSYVEKCHTVLLGTTLHSWSEEIARMWRFTRSNGITEGFHNKMETISRQAYGFRNFENYRQRVQVLCS